VTFVFNGGPLIIHLAPLRPCGPSSSISQATPDPGGPPYHLKDNPWTILRATDLVFVDPVGTGFSQALGDKKDEEFWGYEEDADSVAEFIRMFITTHNRWNSPKYILGESYGGIRTALLVPRLQQELNIGLNGLILISPALNLGTLPFVLTGNDLPYVTHLPAYAAAAYFHKKLGTLAGSQGAPERRAICGIRVPRNALPGRQTGSGGEGEVAERLHRYTGLSKEYLLRSDLRIYASGSSRSCSRRGEVDRTPDGRYTRTS
jgi:carboxypeptidase C (cathepsin A)